MIKVPDRGQRQPDEAGAVGAGGRGGGETETPRPGHAGQPAAVEVEAGVLLPLRAGMAERIAVRAEHQRGLAARELHPDARLAGRDAETLHGLAKDEATSVGMHRHVVGTQRDVQVAGKSSERVHALAHFEGDELVGREFAESGVLHAVFLQLEGVFRQERVDAGVEQHHGRLGRAVELGPVGIAAQPREGAACDVADARAVDELHGHGLEHDFPPVDHLEDDEHAGGALLPHEVAPQEDVAVAARVAHAADAFVARGDGRFAALLQAGVGLIEVLDAVGMDEDVLSFFHSSFKLRMKNEESMRMKLYALFIRHSLFLKWLCCQNIVCWKR